MMNFRQTMSIGCIEKPHLEVRQTQIPQTPGNIQLRLRTLSLKNDPDFMRCLPFGL